MTEPVFVDSNVLVYALDERDPRKQVAAWCWRQELCRTGRGRISFQVPQEWYAQLLRIWPDRRTEAQAEVRDRLAWKPVAADVAILERSWKLQHRYQLSFRGADGVSSESDGLRMSFDGGCTNGAGIARSQSLESVFDRSSVARRMLTNSRHCLC
jgi:predicted nucleic acid-binding protein